jgi:thiopurine S-methyltransferase
VDAQFWQDRWVDNKIGFHLGEVNPYLVEYWPSFKLHAGSRVFVPLCGKSLDLLWLAEQGYDVIGIEISPIAVQAFFKENSLTPNIEQHGAFEVWSVDNITLICGDFFELNRAQLGEVAAVYDRASLIALPVDMRNAYVEQLDELCPLDIPRLLITLDYDQQVMAGPPFAVSDDEIRQLYPPPTEVLRLAASDVLKENDRFRQIGLKGLLESVWKVSE